MSLMSPSTSPCGVANVATPSARDSEEKTPSSTAARCRYRTNDDSFFSTVPRRRRSIAFSVEHLDDDALPDGVGILELAVFAYRYDAHAVAAVETVSFASDGVGVGGYHGLSDTL
jgi:hypothetical protein